MRVGSSGRRLDDHDVLLLIFLGARAPASDEISDIEVRALAPTREEAES